LLTIEKALNTMKNVIKILLIALLFSGAALAQTVPASHVPRAVKKSLREKFLSAKRVEWKIKSDRNYEAEFTLKGTDIAVKFDAKGKWLETESAALRSAIPPAVQDTIATRFKGYKVIEIQTLQRWNEQHVVWEIHLEGTNEIVKAQFNGNGAILSRSAKPKSGKEK
jgi:hypothetical protein